MCVCILWCLGIVFRTYQLPHLNPIAPIASLVEHWKQCYLYFSPEDTVGVIKLMYRKRVNKGPIIALIGPGNEPFMLTIGTCLPLRYYPHFAAPTYI